MNKSDDEKWKFFVKKAKSENFLLEKSENSLIKKEKKWKFSTKEKWKFFDRKRKNVSLSLEIEKRKMTTLC